MLIASTRILLAALALAGLVGAACGDDGGSSDTASRASTAAPEPSPVIDPGDGGRYAPDIDPTNFVDTVDNPYFPLPVGARWEYDAAADGESEHITVEVTGDRRTVMGVPTTVVRDTVTAGGQLVEDTFDWYAQDRGGNVWYFGEAVRNFDRGRFENTDGSFEAGVDGALAGIVMLAHPKVGDAYRQEFFVGEAEDLGEVLRTGAHTEVPFGAFDDVLVTKDWNPLEPDIIEEKYYAPGVGLIRETEVAGEEGSSELVTYTPGA